MKIIYFPTINLTPPQNFIYNDTKLYSTPKALYHNISRHEVNKGHPLETLPFEPRKQLVPGFTAISRNYKLPPLPNVKLSTFKLGIKRSFVHPLQKEGRNASLEKRKRQRERERRVSDPLFARNQPRDPPFLLIPRRYRRGQLSFGGDAQQVRGGFEVIYIHIYIYNRFRETRGQKGANLFDAGPDFQRSC